MCELRKPKSMTGSFIRNDGWKMEDQDQRKDKKSLCFKSSFFVQRENEIMKEEEKFDLEN